MNLSAKPVLVKLLSLSAGILGLLLHVVLCSTGVDEKGLLIAGHWAGRGLWILTVTLIAALFLLTRSIHGSKAYPDAHPASLVSGAGAILAAVAILYSTVSELGTQAILFTILGFASAAALVVIGFCRMLGKTPFFLFHAVLCVFFAVRMVSLYQHWNSDPQLLDYAFYLGAYIALMLTAYQHAAFDAGMGNHRAQWFTGLTATFLCIVSLTSSVDTWLLLGSGIWSLTNLTSLKIRRRRSPSQEV